MSVNSKLLSLIKSRKQKNTKFNYGVLTADKYVKTLQDGVGLDFCSKFASTKQTSFDDILTKAADTLVYSNSGMVVEKKVSIDDFELPKNTLMAFSHVLTTSNRDRDGDILRSQGAEPDPKMLLLFQHTPTLPIGKMIAVVNQDSKQLSVVSAIVDINELSHDAAVMIDNGMGRFSHGFRALEFEEIEDDKDVSGFDVKRFEIMEESLVSVPANTDAETQEVLLSLVEGGKMTSALMKEYGKTIREGRPVIVPGTSIKLKEQNGNTSRELTCSSLADLKAAADAGRIGGKKDENKSRDRSEETGEGRDDSTSEEANGEKSGEEEEATSDTQVKHNEFIISDVVEDNEIDNNISVEKAMVIVLAKCTSEQRVKMINGLKAIENIKKYDLAEQYRALIGK